MPGTCYIYLYKNIWLIMPGRYCSTSGYPQDLKLSNIISFNATSWYMLTIDVVSFLSYHAFRIKDHILMTSSKLLLTLSMIFILLTCLCFKYITTRALQFWPELLCIICIQKIDFVIDNLSCNKSVYISNTLKQIFLCEKKRKKTC